MCCIFTCCGWLVDVVQRAWTFTMSCLIISAVTGVLAVASMSGIALGYNYSLAEYIDLKETNVSIYLKRGVFDDDIADDLDWRRAGRPAPGHIRDANLRTGPPEDDDSTTLRSGRRLDDSVIEAEDQNKFEGSLMRLTAKPVFQDTTSPHITADFEMGEAITRHSKGSLDQFKAIQSLIDSRRAMATGGTTLSPLATYAAGPPLPYLPSVNNPNVPMIPEFQHRRNMAPGYDFRRANIIEPGLAGQSQPLPEISAARLAVPQAGVLTSRMNWLAPKHYANVGPEQMPDYFITSPTYPPPITVRPGTVRPMVTTVHFFPESVIFPYSSTKQVSRTQPPPMQPPMQVEEGQMDKQPFFNEKISLEGEEMSKDESNMMLPRIGMKSPEEEYEDEIKGLPVRKRRSIIASTLVGGRKNPIKRNIIQADGNKSTRNNDNLSSMKNIFTTTIRSTGNNMQTISMDTNYESNSTTDKIPSVIEEINDSQIKTKISNKNNTNQQMDINEKRKSNLVKQVEIISKYEPSEGKKEKSLLDHLLTLTGNKESSLVAETTPKDNVIKSTAKNIRMKTISKSFESKIVSNKYVPKNAAIQVEKTTNLVAKQPFSNQEILNSVSVLSNKAGLLRNSISSTFVKLLQATLTA